MSLTSSILGLPQEILSMIISNITPSWQPNIGQHTPQDLPNLRLTCKQLCASATPEFGRVCISRCHVVISEPGLKGLIEITEHPVLAAYIQTISFGTHVLSDDLDPAGFVRRGNYNSRNCEYQFTQLVGMLREYRAHRELQHQFRRSSDAVDLLSRALENLKRNNLRVTLGIYDDAGHRSPGVKFIKGYGFDRTFGSLLSNFTLWDEVGLSWFLDWHPDPSSALQLIRDAAKSSDYSLQNLEIDACQGFSFPLSTRANHATWTGRFHRIIRRLISTRSNLCWMLNTGLEFSLKWWDDDACCAEFRLQTDRQRFEYRTLHTGNFGSRAGFDGITSDYGSLKTSLFCEMFREIRLENVMVASNVLTQFLERHVVMLERLELSKVQLDVTSVTRSRFLLFLATKMTSLRVLEWDGFEMWDDKMDGDYMRQEIPQRAWRGTEAIKTGLIELAREVTNDITEDLIDGLDGTPDEGMSDDYWEGRSIESWEEGSEGEVHPELLML